MSFHVLNQYRIKVGALGTTDDCGNNGAFRIGHLNIIASDGKGWEHVSVSKIGHTPSWDEMCYIKSLFWDAEDCVVQYHPPESEYVNCHPYCLHMWRPTDDSLPRPPSYLVGPA